MNIKTLLACTVYGGVSIYSIITRQYLIIPSFIALGIVLVILEKVINFTIIRIGKILDKRKTDIFLPVINKELTEEQKDYVLKRLRKLEGCYEVDYLAEQFINKVKYDELKENDLEMLNKLLKLRLEINILH